MTLKDSYEIIEVIGTGAMATVSKAVQKSLDRFVAIKQIRPHLSSDPQHERRFEREAKAAAALSHMNIVDVIDFGQDEGLYIVIEYIDGPSLFDVLATCPDVPLAVALSTVIQVLNGLEYGHNHGVIHRDVKAANIMFNSSGLAKITDFGIAQDLDRPALTQTGQMLGTASYMAPEQAQGLKIDHRADLFSVGVVLYELLTHALPFPGDSVVGVFVKVVKEPHIPMLSVRSDVPAVLVDIVDRALTKDPTGRFFDAAEFSYALESFATQERVQIGTKVVQSFLRELGLITDPRDTGPTSAPLPHVAPIPSAEPAIARPTLGLLPLTGCFGCQVNLLDLHQDLLAFRDMFDIRFIHLMDVKNPPAIDVGFVEGSVSNSEDEKRVRTFRERCTTLIALGTCACFGGLPGLRNLFRVEDVIERSYVRSESTISDGGKPDPSVVPEISCHVRPVSDVVKVDAVIPGCPSPHEILMPALEAISRRESLEPPTHNLCFECQRSHRAMLTPKREYVSGSVSALMELDEIDPELCFLEQGVLCMGMATRAGCRTRCLEHNVPCSGCMGPAPRVRETCARLVNTLASLLPVGSTRFRHDLVGLGYRYTLPTSVISRNGG
ncbi:MAG: protein kinase domain-containing protein [Planctomycetota bacterium]|jgi:serine/threonine protein kinase